MSTTIRRLALPLALLVVGLPVGIGAVVAMGSGEPPQEASDSFRPISRGSIPRDERHAQARWDKVSTFTGAGAAEKSFAIAEGANQWKADWRCSSGKLRMSVGRKSEATRVLVDTSCPDFGAESSTGDGPGRLQVTASAPWRVVIEQEVDTALEEPPLAGMTKASLLTRGRFHPIQKQGEGTMSLYRLGGGRLALRFEDFYTSPSPGLELWLSRAKNPNSTLDARDAPYVNAGKPRSTFGSYNQLLPREIGADEIDSIVIWCPAVQIAFSAAPLTTP
ncbi:MAG: DM13 domain-containing protein [Actinomycetota bacterium]|nr:DM13 domain-containing protein [Actinomycetota bacterium]